MGLFTTAKKVGTGLLDMDKPSRMARSVDQGYNTDVYHGSTHNLTNMDALKTNIESDWGQGIYSSNNIDDVNANYAGIGPDLTSRIDRRMDDIDSRIDGYEFEDLINAFPEMTEKEAKSIASGNSEVFDTFKRRVATKEIAGPNSGVVYPLKLKTEDYAVIDIKNPTRIEGRDYYAEAADDLNRSDFGSDDDYEDALYELADDFRASDYDSPLETISQTLRDSGADDYTIEEIIQKVSDADSISAFDLDLAIREAEIYAYDDELGNMIPNGAISAQVFRDLGYKGVKDNTVNAKFPTMEGMNRDTTHYITFPQNEQTIRSVNAKFDPAKSNSTSLLASNPVATAAGLGGILAMTGSEDADAGVVSSGVRIAKEILNLRAQGRANEVTNEMMSYADPQYLFDNTPLPMDTASRLNRAEGGGFDTNVPLYHSGNKEIESINPDFKASFGGEKGAFYTTTNPDVANTYGGDLMQQFYGKTPEDALIVDAHNRDFYELDKKTITSQGALGDVVPQQFDKWSAGHRSIGRPELIHTDMVSAGYPSDTTVFNRLKDEGAYNRIDPEDEFYDGTPSTVRADQNATNLRSTSARFDPEFSHLSNTLASNPIATTSAGLMAMDNVGQESQGLMDAIAGRDAMLTSQQVEYLNNQRELQQLLGTQDTNKFNYADIVPMKRNKETGERSFAMTGLLRDIIEAGHNVVQSQRTGIQNQQSLWDIIL